MTPADYFILGFATCFVLTAAFAWSTLEKMERTERDRWQRKPPLTEQEIVDRAERKKLWG